MTELFSSIAITIGYRTTDGRIEELRLAPDEFFDVEDADAPVSLAELVWQHNHAVDYLHVDASMLSGTSLEVDWAATGERIVDVERFWNQGKGRSICRRTMLHEREVTWSSTIEIQTLEGIHFMHFDSDAKGPDRLREHVLVTPNEEVLRLFP